MDEMNKWNAIIQYKNDFKTKERMKLMNAQDCMHDMKWMDMNTWKECMDDMIEWKFMIEMDDWNGMNGMQCMSIVWNIHTEQTYT